MSPATPTIGPRSDDLPVRWLDEEERATWLGLLRVMARLPALLDARLARHAGLTLFEYTVLAMLSEQPDGALRMSRLASVTNASPSRLSHAARQLEADGHLVRAPDPDDRRCIRAVLTTGGRRLIEAAAPDHVAAVRSLVVDPLTGTQLRNLRMAVDCILDRLDPLGATDPNRCSSPMPPERTEGSSVPADPVGASRPRGAP